MSKPYSNPTNDIERNSNQAMTDITSLTKQGKVKQLVLSSLFVPASVALLDAHPTGVQAVPGSNTAGSAMFFHGD